MRNDSYKIGELAKLSGLTPRTLRYYEELSLICSERSPGGQRLYRSDSLARVSIIKSLKIAGFSLEEIRHILLDWKESTTGRQAAAKLVEILQEKQRQIAETVSALNKLRKQLEISINLLDTCASCQEVQDPELCDQCEAPKEYSKKNPLIDEILKS